MKIVLSIALAVMTVAAALGFLAARDFAQKLNHANSSLVNAAETATKLDADLKAAKAEQDIAARRIADLESELASTSAKVGELVPLAKKARTLPVKITRRKAALGAGTVYQFHNTSGHALPVSISFSNPSFKSTKTIDVTLDPVLQKEVGHLEGWSGSPGDVIEITSDGYDSKTTKVTD